MSLLDTLYSIFKGANPDASDEDIKAHVESLKASPEQMSSALGSLTPQDSTPPIEMKGEPDMSLNVPSANDQKSNFDVGVSDDTVKMNGRPDSLPSSVGDSQPAALPPMPSPVTPPAPTPEVPSQASPSATPAAKTPAAPDSTDALKALVSPSPKSGDDQAMLDAERRKHNLGIIPVAAAGIGDAISNAASAFGAHGTAGTQEKVAEGINTSIDKDKAAFEAQQRKDPNSDVSRHYQKVLGLMLGDHAKSMDVSHMSAENIASTLPEVEKYMQKELGLKQIKATKDLSMAMHEQGRQDKLEKDTREWVDNLSKARNGELGVQNGKVDQARHLLQAFKQAEDTGKPFTNATYREIAVGLANLMSNGGKTNSETEHAIAQATMKGDINKALTYAGMDPQTLGGTTDSMMKTLEESILRQGMEAEKQRNKFIEDQKSIAPSGLNKEQSDRILNREYGNSLKEFQDQKSPAIQRAKAPEGTVKQIGNRNFTVINGTWHEILH